MGSVSKGMEERGSFFGGEIELARRAVCDVGGNDTGNLLTERLNGD